ncbi:MAG: hypothetical protein HN742_07150 [Lentisphaerae bacterium]|jgi:hypothetical protein|nr:hypothetical protein [Lentisphaerota bacterium]
MQRAFERFQSAADDLRDLNAVVSRISDRLDNEIRDARDEFNGQQKLFEERSTLRDKDGNVIPPCRMDAHTRVKAAGLIEIILGNCSDTGSSRVSHDLIVNCCKELREVLGLVEQPDLPPADTAGGE